MSEPPGEGWMTYIERPFEKRERFPWQFDRIELWRDGWDGPMVTRHESMQPQMNVADLYWRPAAKG